MTDILLLLILIAITANGLATIYSGTRKFDLERTALSIYSQIAAEFGGDNLTAELARQQARVWFARISHEYGFPMSARKSVVNRVVSMTQEKVKTDVFIIKNNL